MSRNSFKIKRLVNFYFKLVKMEMSIGLITTKSFAVDQSVGFLSKIIRRIS